MDIAQLEQIFADHTSGGILTLDSTILGSNEIMQLFETYLVDKQLVINSATVSLPQNDSIAVSGVAGGLPFAGMTVNVTFSVVNGTTELYLSADTPAGWTLPDSFLAWKHQFFPSLRFLTPPVLLLGTSHAPPDSRYGLFFRGTLDATSVLGPFIWLISGQTSMALQGEITIDAVGPQMVLATSPVAGFTLGFFQLSPVSLEVATDVTVLQNPSPLNPPVVLRVKTGIGLQTTAKTFTIPLVADFYGQDLVVFNADLNQVVNASLQEFASLLNNIDINRSDLLPPGLTLPNIIKLKYLTFQVVPTGAKQLKMVSIGVEKQDGAWNLADTIAIDDIWISFAVTDPLEMKYLSIGLYGVISIGGGVLELDAVYPDFSFTGRLQEGTEINLLEMIEHFLGTSETSNIGLDALDVVGLSFSLQPSPLAYSAEIDLDGSWYIGLIDSVFLEIRDLSFSMSKLAGSSITGSLAGTVTISGINVSISASHPDADGGWIFDGSTGSGQEIPIGTLIEDVVNLFGDVSLPPAITDLTIENLHVLFNTNTSDFTFTCEGMLPLGDEAVTIVVTIDLQYEAITNTYTKTFGGTITIGSRQFALRFDQSNTTTSLIATYDKQGGEKIRVKEDLIAPLSTAVSQYIPDNLEIDFKDVLFVFRKSAPAQDGSTITTFLFGLDLSIDFPSLSNLPLVGQILPSDQTIKVNNVQILVASASVQQSDVVSLNSQIPAGVTKLAGTDLRAGLNFSASIMFGGTPQTLAVAVVNQAATTTPPPAISSPPATGVTAADNVKWFTLQKAFGPVNFNRVGVKYENAVAQFLLDASLSLAGLTLSLDGLSFGSPLNEFAPQFDLRGLGIDYRSGAAEIGGAFLHTRGTLNGETYDEYDGAAVIKATGLTLSALGSYAALENPSLFIYAILDYPLGGPSFFFVTGLAAGFGYNRALIVPSVDQIAQFPLVTAAVNGASPPQSTKDLTDVLAKLALYIHPELGQNFFAIGIKFTSFKIIDSFVLLTVAFGNELEINVLGLSTMIQPPAIPGEPAVTPIAVVQMAVKASFVPARGFLGISAQLTSASYLIDRACQLTGGFAFYTWFAGEHAGEFVQTLGGYHPSFVAPDYYPRVPRLGYNWQVNSELSIKGEAYFALTAAVLMAGLRIQASWNSGNLSAWFNLTADFIIAWKPFHYDAAAHVNLGASYTFQFFGTQHLTFDVGADLHIWGPEFSGQAHINLDIISFDISFGSSPAQQLSPIAWQTFQQSFLPAESAICSIAVADGMVGKQGQDAQNLGVMNPKNLVLVTNTVVPSSGAQINTSALAVSQVSYLDDGTRVSLLPFSATSTQGDLVQTTQPGAKTKATGAPAIGPVGVQVSEFSSVHTITITRNGLHVERDFAYTPVLKNVPTALWGQYARQGPYLLPPDLNGQRFISDALSGFEIRPAVQATPGETAPVDPGKLQYDPENIQAAYEWEQNPVTFQAETLDEAGRRQRISSSIVDTATVAVRQQLCQALGISPDTINLDQTIAGEVASAFLFAPQVEKA